MKRVVFIVEGDTEISFIQKCVIPYLYEKGFSHTMNAQKIVDQYTNPEDINGGSQTAPSKRLMKIFPYEKTTDGEMILEALNINDIRAKCPRFNAWMEKLEEGLKNDHF